MRRILERILFAIAALGLGSYVWVEAESALYETVQDRRLAFALREGPASTGPSRAFTRAGTVDASAPSSVPRASFPLPGDPDLIGRLEAPRLGLRAIVAPGIDGRTLRHAVGHVPGTALPGEPGNVALAGHRDRAFRRLRDVREGDQLRLVTPTGTYEYVVEGSEVVSPDRSDLLGPTSRPMLTLITCYPFFMVGPAPDRFVVRAHQVSRP